ncbi:MAG: hypothetical protein ACLFV3_09150 [Phycisphaeraceae bacterium]
MTREQILELLGDAHRDIGQWCSLAREQIACTEGNQPMPLPIQNGLDVSRAIQKRLNEAIEQRLQETEQVDRDRR